MTSKYILKSAFTLIELLVVIAIIGVLSGLIIVGMSSTTQSATMAKAQRFSASLRDSLLSNLVSEWKFDDATNLGKDSWGSNNCTTVGTITSQTTGCVYGNCISLTGTSGNYLSCSNTTSLSITSAITVEAWVNPTNLTSSGGIATHEEGSGDDNAWTLYINSSNANFNIMAQDLTYKTASAAIPAAGRFYHLVGTFDGLNVKIYLNAVSGNSVSYASSTTIRSNSNPTDIGSESGRVFNGLIDNLRIYNSAIPTSLIREHYYSGIKKLLAERKITHKDYLIRINEI